MAGSGGDTNLYWALPDALAIALALGATGGGIALLLLGHVALGAAVLGLAALALAVLVQEAVRRERPSGGYGRARALSGYATASIRTWSRTSGRIARLRVESGRLLRERRRLQFRLGGATYAGDERAVTELVAEMRALDRELTRLGADAERTIAEAQTRLARERFAIASTEIRRAQ